MFIIEDWAGNRVFDDEEFTTFDDAEEFLENWFESNGLDYEEERQEYYILSI